MTSRPPSTTNATCRDCAAPIDGSYGSGRFCGMSCAKRFAARECHRRRRCLHYRFNSPSCSDPACEACFPFSAAPRVAIAALLNPADDGARYEDGAGAAVQGAPCEAVGVQVRVEQPGAVSAPLPSASARF